MTIFGIGPVELLIIIVIALVVVGPERLPEMLHQVGVGVGKLRKMVNDLRDQARTELGDDYDNFEQMSRQLRDLNPRRQIQELSRSLLDETGMSKVDLSPWSRPSVPLPQSDVRDLASEMLNDDLLDAPLSETLDSIETATDE